MLEFDETLPPEKRIPHRQAVALVSLHHGSSLHA